MAEYFKRAVSGARHRRCRDAAEAARTSKSTASSSWSDGSPPTRRSARSVPLSRRSCAPSRRCAASASRSPASWPSSASRPIQDLLFLLPLRYEDRTRVVPIGSLRVGERAVVEGEVLLTEVAFRGRRQLLCRIGDGSGSLTLRFFHFSSARSSKGSRAARACAASARSAAGPTGLEIVHPEYRRVASERYGATEEALTPIYPLTEGVQQGRLRQLTEHGAARVSRIARCRTGCPPGVLAAAAVCRRCAKRSNTCIGRRRTRIWSCSRAVAIRCSGGSRSRSCWRIN